ncbi:hypothetical protein D4R42_05235 [bacterium]|nr:MAG: hypothetical protein D4R42_05235 [bacterium]
MVWAGQSAYPLEESLAGALQHSDNPKEFAKSMLRELCRDLDPNILVSAALDAGIGWDVERGIQDKGLLQLATEFVRGNPDPEIGKQGKEKLMDLGLEFLPLGQQAKRLWKAETDIKEGKVPIEDPDELKRNMIALLRTYELKTPQMNRRLVNYTRSKIGNNRLRNLKSRINQHADDPDHADAVNAQSKRIAALQQVEEAIAASKRAFPDIFDRSKLYIDLKKSGLGLSVPELNAVLNGTVSSMGARVGKKRPKLRSWERDK